jgi:hypothetical protein
MTKSDTALAVIVVAWIGILCWFGVRMVESVMDPIYYKNYVKEWVK